MLKIRVSRTYDELSKTPKKDESFIKKLSDACDVCVVFEHEADETVSRTHIHAYVENPKVSTDTMKNWVKKTLAVTAFPKTDWTFVGATDRGFITYLTKGKLTPCSVKGISKEEIDTLKAAWVDQPPAKGKIQYKLKIENPQEQKMRQAEMVAEIRRRIHTDAPADDMGYHNPRHVLNIIIAVVVKQNNTVCGRYKIRDYYDTVMMLENSSHHANAMENFVGFRV